MIPDISVINAELEAIDSHTERIAIALEQVTEQLRIQNRLLAAITAVMNESSTGAGWTVDGLKKQAAVYLKP